MDLWITAGILCCLSSHAECVKQEFVMSLGCIFIRFFPLSRTDKDTSGRNWVTALRTHTECGIQFSFILVHIQNRSHALTYTVGLFHGDLIRVVKWPACNKNMSLISKVSHQAKDDCWNHCMCGRMQFVIVRAEWYCDIQSSKYSSE